MSLALAVPICSFSVPSGRGHAAGAQSPKSPFFWFGKSFCLFVLSGVKAAVCSGTCGGPNLLQKVPNLFWFEFGYFPKNL